MEMEIKWQKEYEQKGIPSSYKIEPSQTISEFNLFLKQHNVASGRLLDLGCGKGRNAFFLAQQGYEIDCIDFIPANIRFIEEEAEKRCQPIKSYCQSVCAPFPFKEKTFDAAIDIFCYKHQVDERMRFQYRCELHRVLKETGFYTLSLASYQDGFYGPLRNNLSQTKNVVIDPYTSIPSILFGKEDIEQEFYPHFKLVAINERHSHSEMHGKLYSRSILDVIMKKNA
ncbi:hypothetical protein PNK_1438 [Candidatus Protochlamydia naegleriophila]|uniref:Methyltransferase domain-containing protein n=1 Tax=Candidatus Protochlamydia naegleriophila TaxID=389348 RepID=A0A0U5JE08_9BACT|nr:class I SAM-dependent methyltransferase [Candidatus Protochlamydia naegleriophila]CUI17050.1 hypothetical protein PNK_1438 [Candidatus Protochlamydia naegleriophila]